MQIYIPVEISDGTTTLRYIDSSTMLVLGGNTYVSAPFTTFYLQQGNIHTHPVVIGRNDALESFLDANVSTTGDLTMKIQIWNQTGGSTGRSKCVHRHSH